jgi:hypothetical protein
MKPLRSLFPFLFVKEEIEKSYSSNKNERLTQYEENELATTSKCPDCGGDLLDGPCGGLSINVTCKKCCARFNVSPIFSERISNRTTPVPA